ncbi:MAG: hypothetical protein QOJ07_2263 [Thermoleophilaceae bacterium]|nr:hypothetical protein [Thermoleophilaceae bacterium]
MNVRKGSLRTDDPYVGFRMRTFDAGCLLSYAGCFAYAIYYALTWHGQNRPALVAMSLGTLVLTTLLRLLPIARIVASERWREPFFVAWSMSLILVIALGAALDGGAHAALTLAFFLPLSFAALSYPMRMMVVVTAIDVAVFLLMAILSHDASAGFMFMFACALTTAGWMSALQSRIHEQHLNERTRNDQRFTHLAFHDSLTGLPNRALLEGRVEAALAHGDTCILLGVDLDGFKLVNDSLGHAAGDEILRSLARRLEPVAAPDGLVSRQGGDEFALFTTSVGDDPVATAHQLAQDLVTAIREPLTVDGTEFELDASIGIAVHPLHAKTSEELMLRADAAMYEAKANGHGTITVYSHDHDDARSRLQMTSRLRRAIAGGELIVHYQPIFEPGTGRIAMVEALARWQDPERGLIPPIEFIPFAEQTGLISEIGDRVVDLICAQAVRWRAAGLAPAISFNVSPRQLRDPDFAGRLSERISASGVAPAAFTVEITESAMVGDPARIVPALHELADTGVRLAIDDFGAEHSSLGRLRNLPVHMLKLDRSLLRGTPDDKRAAAIVSSLLRLAEAMEVIAVVEGVETEDQRTFLVGGGCPLAQGFALGRPQPPAETTLLLEQDAIAVEIAEAKAASTA